MKEKTLGLAKRVADKEREKTADDVIAEMDVVYTPDEAGNFFYSKLKRHPDMQVFIERRLGPIVDVEIKIKNKFLIDVIFRNWSDYPGVMTVHVTGPNQERTMIVKRLMKIDLFKKSMFTGNGSYTERNPVFYNRYQEDTLRKDLISMIADTINSIVSKKLGLKESRSSLGLAKKVADNAKGHMSSKDRAIENISYLHSVDEASDYIKNLLDIAGVNYTKSEMSLGHAGWTFVVSDDDDARVCIIVRDWPLGNVRYHPDDIIVFINPGCKNPTDKMKNNIAIPGSGAVVDMFANLDDKTIIGCDLLNDIVDKAIELFKQKKENAKNKASDVSESANLGLAKKTRGNFDFDHNKAIDRISTVSTPEEALDMFTLFLSDGVQYEVFERQHLLKPSVAADKIIKATGQDNQWSCVLVFDNDISVYFYYDIAGKYGRQSCGADVCLGVFLSYRYSGGRVQETIDRCNKFLLNKYGVDHLFDQDYNDHNTLPLFFNPEDPLHLKVSMIKDVADFINKEYKSLSESNLGLAKKTRQQSQEKDAVAGLALIDNTDDIIDYVINYVEAEEPGSSKNKVHFDDVEDDGIRVEFTADRFGDITFVTNKILIGKDTNSIIKDSYPELFGKELMSCWAFNIKYIDGKTDYMMLEDSHEFDKYMLQSQGTIMWYNPDNLDALPVDLLNYIAKSVVNTIRARKTQQPKLNFFTRLK